MHIDLDKCEVVDKEDFLEILGGFDKVYVYEAGEFVSMAMTGSVKNVWMAMGRFHGGGVLLGYGETKHAALRAMASSSGKDKFAKIVIP